MPCFAKAGSLTSATNPGAGSTRTVIELSPSKFSTYGEKGVANLIVSLTINK